VGIVKQVDIRALCTEVSEKSVIEFVGNPGAGKSFIRSACCELLLDSGRNVSSMRAQPPSCKSSFALKWLTWVRCLSGGSGIYKNRPISCAMGEKNPERYLDDVERYFKKKTNLKRLSRASCKVRADNLVLLDRGPVMNLAVFRCGTSSRCKEAWRKVVVHAIESSGIDCVVHVKSSLEESVERLVKRNKKVKSGIDQLPKDLLEKVLPVYRDNINEILNVIKEKTSLKVIEVTNSGVIE